MWVYLFATIGAEQCKGDMYERVQASYRMGDIP